MTEQIPAIPLTMGYKNPDSSFHLIASSSGRFMGWQEFEDAQKTMMLVSSLVFATNR